MDKKKQEEGLLKKWSTVPTMNARLILDVMAALLSGNAALAYTVKKLDGSLEFRLGPLLNDAEEIANGLMIRGNVRAEEARRIIENAVGSSLPDTTEEQYGR